MPPRDRAKSTCRFLQREISNRMAGTVVDALKPIQIDVVQRELTPMASSVTDRSFEIAHELRAIRQAREHVVIREPVQPLIVNVALQRCGHERGDETDEIAIRIPEVHDRSRDETDGTVVLSVHG